MSLQKQACPAPRWSIFYKVVQQCFNSMHNLSGVIDDDEEYLCLDVLSIDSFIDLVKRKDLGKLKFALREADFNVNSQDEDGRTGLHHAIIHDKLDVAQQLVDFGVDVNVKDETPERETSLHAALRLGNLEAIKLLLEAPGLDIIKCDALQPSKRLPVTCICEDVCSAQLLDGDTTLTKRKSFGDQYLVLVRQNTNDYLENNFPPGRDSIKDLIIVDDDHAPPLEALLERLDLAQLTGLYLAGVPLYGDQQAPSLRLTALSSLVLTQCHLRLLPQSLFELETLRVLRVDWNGLQEIPVEIGQLRNLRQFSCDHQRPRLRALSQGLTRCDNLEVLSFSGNKIDNISLVVQLPRLRVLRCDRNKIIRLPSQLYQLRDLVLLDCSYNRIENIPASFVDLIRRLYKFEYFNLTLRPRQARSDKQQLLAHLELQNFMMQGSNIRSLKDTSLMVCGESHSGKTTLVEALKTEKGVCKMDLRQSSTFDVTQFDLHSNEESTYISAFVLANDILDNFSRNIQVDMYLLVVDLTSLELQNGSQHLFARHVARLQMWLCALYEICPDTPVLLVGTHAEMVKSISFQDIWAILDSFLDQGRAHHVKHFHANRLTNCLLCNPKGSGVRHVLAKSRSGSAGFVDLAHPHGEPMMNGHLPSGDGPPPGKLKFPHIVGYYEIDSKKNLPKESKRSNVSVDQLKQAIIRTHLKQLDETGIPPSWIEFARNLTTINTQQPDNHWLPFEQIVSIARSFDIPQSHVGYMLQYFHERGKVVYFGGDELLSKLVITNPTWFINAVGRVLEAADASQLHMSELMDLLHYKNLDRLLQHRPTTSTTSTAGSGIVGANGATWLLHALQKLEIVTSFSDSFHDAERVFMIPSLLELGTPCSEIWPDLPEWQERQITYDFSINVLKPNMFCELVARVAQDGRRALDIVSDPRPVFLSHHIVFFTALDSGGCDDCHQLRRRSGRSSGGASGGGGTTKSTSVFTNGSQTSTVGSSTQSDFDYIYDDDVLHKVHIQLLPSMDYVRVTVRGLSPCCVIKTVLDFVETHLDDVTEEETYIFNDACSTRSGVSGYTALSCSGSGSSAEQDNDRVKYLLCPKCVLLRHAKPERIPCQNMSARKKAICTKWHSLGSWQRALSGNYSLSESSQARDNHVTNLPDYEHPRLALMLPPSVAVSMKDWYLSSRMKFLEGFEVHFLCEYTAYWHLTDQPGIRLTQSAEFVKRVGNHLPAIMSLSLNVLQVVCGVDEHKSNAKVLAPVIADLIKSYDYLRNVDAHIADPHAWLGKNKDRVVNMLTKVLSNANDSGLPDLYFKVGNAMAADSVFSAPSKSSRSDIARFLRLDASARRFGPLRPLYVGKEIRWLCDCHYEELRAMPAK